MEGPSDIARQLTGDATDFSAVKARIERHVDAAAQAAGSGNALAAAAQLEGIITYLRGIVNSLRPS